MVGCNAVKDEGCCSCNSKKVLVEYLYLDLKTCDRCIGTDAVLEGVLKEINPALSCAGYEVEFKKMEISSKEMAEKYRFLSSPTIRVNGMDICESVAENSCGCCSDISGTDVECRVFEFEEKIMKFLRKRCWHLQFSVLFSHQRKSAAAWIMSCLKIWILSLKAKIIKIHVVPGDENKT